MQIMRTKRLNKKAHTVCLLERIHGLPSFKNIDKKNYQPSRLEEMSGRKYKTQDIDGKEEEKNQVLIWFLS